MKHLLFHLIFLCIVTKGYSQITTAASISSGLSYVSKKQVDAQYFPVYSPGANFQLNIPLTNRIAAIVGIGYLRKGFHDVSVFKTVRTRTEYIVNTRYHYLSFPLMVSYKVLQSKHAQFWCDAGMNYNFYLMGKLSYQVNDYYNNQLIGLTAFTTNIKSGLTYSNYNYKTYGRVSAMDACIQLRVRTILYNRYTIGLYHDHSLYNISISGGPNSSIKLRSSGVFFGIIF